MTAASDLTTLSQVKTWLGLPAGNSASDTMLAALITGVSRNAYAMMQRPNILPATYSEVRDGNGIADRLLIRNWPVNSIISVADGLTTLTPSPNVASYGYALEPADVYPPGRPQMLYFRCGQFCRGIQNIAISYRAGYQFADAQTVAGGTLTALAPYGAWATDQGVSYATGAALTNVSGTPAVGQYSVALGVYTFNAADNGQPVIMTYGYIPADLAQAALEWIALRFKSRDFIGLRSKTLGGQETITYDTGPMPSIVMQMIQPYKRVAMV